MANLYQDTAEPAAPTPPLDGDVRTDVAVVGGGITGLSTALHLAEGGAGVVLLEAEEPGWGASGRNGGQVNPGLKHDPDAVEREFGRDLGGRMNAFAGAAPALVFDLIERHGIRCGAPRHGAPRAAVRPERGAMLDRRGGDLNPLSYARGLVRAALGAGAAVHGGTRALGMQRNGALWRIQTARGFVSAPQVVLATNGYTDDLWPNLRRTIVPLFGAIAATDALPDAIARGIMPSRAVLFESGTITVYYRVDGGRRLLIGGRGPMREISSASSIPYLLAYARTLWPALAAAQWKYAWGGRLAMTPDQYLHIHEPAGGVTACLGYNGRGVAMATAMGAQLAPWLMSPSFQFDMPITGMKTIRFHALWKLAVRAAIAHGRITDFLGI